MDENFQFHVGYMLANLFDFFQRQLARQDDAAQTLLAPEFDTGPVDRIGLHRQMNRHMGEVFAHQHDQPRVGHDQRIRVHGYHRLQILEEGAQLGVVRGYIDHHVKTLALGLGLFDANSQVGVVEFVVAHPQAVARLACVHRVGAIGKGVTHVFQGAGRGEEFGRSKAHSRFVRKKARW